MGRRALAHASVADCKSLFDCLAMDASVPEDRGTALTVASLREGVRQEWEETKNDRD